MKHVLIGFTGLAESGKSTAADFLTTRGFKKQSFAEPLKEMVSGLTPDGKIDKARDRKLLQYLGTDYFRDTIDRDYWVKLMTDKLPQLLARHSVVIDDVRFDNEAEAIKSLGGIIIHVSRVTPGSDVLTVKVIQDAMERVSNALWVKEPLRSMSYLDGFPGIQIVTTTSGTTPSSKHISESGINPDLIDIRITNSGTFEEFQDLLQKVASI